MSRWRLGRGQNQTSYDFILTSDSTRLAVHHMTWKFSRNCRSKSDRLEKFLWSIFLFSLLRLILIFADHHRPSKLHGHIRSSWDAKLIILLGNFLMLSTQPTMTSTWILDYMNTQNKSQDGLLLFCHHFLFCVFVCKIISEYFFIIVLMLKQIYISSMK